MNVIIVLAIIIVIVTLVITYALCCVSAKCSREEEQLEMQKYFCVKNEREE